RPRRGCGTGSRYLPAAPNSKNVLTTSAYRQDRSPSVWRWCCRYAPTSERSDLFEQLVCKLHGPLVTALGARLRFVDTVRSDLRSGEAAGEPARIRQR